MRTFAPAIAWLLAGLFAAAPAHAIGLPSDAPSPLNLAPLQPAHEGHWYDPTDPGHGMHISFIAGQPPEAELFVALWGVRAVRPEGSDLSDLPITSYWAVAQSTNLAAYYQGTYILDLVLSPLADDTLIQGTMALRPEMDGTIGVYTYLRWDDPAGEWEDVRFWTTYHQLTTPVPGPMQYCTTIGFSPALPVSPWCVPVSTDD